MELAYPALTLSRHEVLVAPRVPSTPAAPRRVLRLRRVRTSLPQTVAERAPARTQRPRRGGWLGKGLYHRRPGKCHTEPAKSLASEEVSYINRSDAEM
jgi:hypothetical protein